MQKTVREFWKDKLQAGRKYLQIIFLKKEFNQNT